MTRRRSDALDYPRWLPSYPQRGLWLYAFEFSDGSVKIGASCSPLLRAQAFCMRRARRIVRAHVQPVRVSWNRCTKLERDALDRADRIASRRHGEWFHGLRFGEAVTLLRQVVRPAA